MHNTNYLPVLVFMINDIGNHNIETLNAQNFLEVKIPPMNFCHYQALHATTIRQTLKVGIEYFDF